MAEFSEYRDQKIPEDEVESHAECLAAMDCLMHHMNDEDEIGAWLQDGVPDDSCWHPFDEAKEGPRGLSYGPAARRWFYKGLVRNMTYGDYEACVKIFACAVKAQCFKTKYQPRSFT